MACWRILLNYSSVAGQSSMYSCLTACGIGRDWVRSFWSSCVFGAWVHCLVVLSAYGLMSCGITATLWSCTQVTSHTWTSGETVTYYFIQSWQLFSKHLIWSAQKRLFLFHNWLQHFLILPVEWIVRSSDVAKHETFENRPISKYSKESRSW